MKYSDMNDNFLEKYNPDNLMDYFKLRRWRAGTKDYRDLSNRVVFQIIRSGVLNIEIGPYKHELKPGMGFIMDLNENNAIKVQDWNSFDTIALIYPYHVINNFYQSIVPREENILCPVKSDKTDSDKSSQDDGKGLIVNIRPRLIEATPKVLDLVENVRSPLRKEIFGGKTESLLNSKMLLLFLLRVNNYPQVVNYLKYEPGGNLSSELKKKMSYVLEYIHDNFSQDIDLDKLAHVGFINKYYLLKVFKQSVGKTPMEYIAVIRSEKAKELLINSNEQISSIAESVGFSNPSAFSQFFKRMTGYYPRNFRQEYSYEKAYKN